MSTRFDLMSFFDAYSKNYSKIYLEKYIWGEDDTYSLITHRILNYFSELGIYLGYNVEMERRKFQDIKLKGGSDLIWSIENIHNGYRPILHIECENASNYSKIEEELIKLNQSPVNNKIGVFQFTSDKLNIDTLKNIDDFVKTTIDEDVDVNWLIICDIWNLINEEIMEDDAGHVYKLEYYPLIGLVYNNDMNMKISKIYQLPFNKILTKEGQWNVFKDIHELIQHTNSTVGNTHTR